MSPFSVVSGSLSSVVIAPSTVTASSASASNPYNVPNAGRLNSEGNAVIPLGTFWSVVGNVMDMVTERL